MLRRRSPTPLGAPSVDAPKVERGGGSAYFAFSYG